ncbi:competence protein CoiA [Bacillus sp. 179-C3.3 HS]|uniref:competence protein CoiA n=1 Tax=Bacillus sp. 179-C3.3 HS TaxID=3232162 RepID=UPI0039A0E268
MNTAVMENGKILQLSQHLTKDRLEHMRKTSKFYCPECRQEVRLKLGEHRVYHFAHLQLTTCSLATGETDYHQAGKVALMNWLNQIGYQPMLEKYVSAIQQRPDITVVHHNICYAIEFQCAHIPERELIKRTLGLQSVQMVPIWVLGANRLNRKSNQLFSFSSIHWGILRLSRQKRLIFYCPVQQTFIHLDHILMFQPSKICAAMSVRRPSAYPHLSALLKVHQPARKQALYTQWFKCVQQFRQRPPRILSNESKRLRQVFYEHHQTSFPFLPTEVFLPLTEATIFTSPVYVWQGWLYDFMVRRKGQRPVTIPMLTKEIFRCVKAKQIKLRYADVTMEEVKEVVYAYVKALVHQEFLRITKEGNYEVMSNQLPIQTVEEALKRDAFLFQSHVSGPL